MSPAKLPRITTTRVRVLASIDALASAEGYPPTVREIGELLGVGPATIHGHLSALRRAGCVSWQPHSPRTIRLTPAGQRIVDEAIAA